MSDLFILDGKMVVRAKSLMQWAAWFETANRHVADETIAGIRISTVFLGLDHNHWGKGDPLLFETMTFAADGEDLGQWRYFTWGEAEEGHKMIVEVIKAQADKADLLSKDVLQKLLAKSKQAHGVCWKNQKWLVDKK